MYFNIVADIAFRRLVLTLTFKFQVPNSNCPFYCIYIDYYSIVFVIVSLIYQVVLVQSPMNNHVMMSTCTLSPYVNVYQIHGGLATYIASSFPLRCPVIYPNHIMRYSYVSDSDRSADPLPTNHVPTDPIQTVICNPRCDAI